ncbi:MAG: 3-phosphoshikimate 1-carboxyvinyltransferase [Crocinitomicaceae bacterium]|nr:3-phosphoshikimate 1-carboxyvinyltransferase [Crocinitomicaceae bacterium]
MKAEVLPSELSGETTVAGSKSIAQRAAVCALMAAGESEISFYPENDDCAVAISIVQQLGGIVTRSGSSVLIKGGYPANFQAGIKNPRHIISCGESGLSARMFTSVSALSNEEIKITGNGSLLKRPFGEFENFLPGLGASVSTNSGRLPVTVKGPLRGGNVSINGALSSQYLTGILLAAGQVKNDTVISVENLNSKPYIDLTIEVASCFGVNIRHKHYSLFSIKGGQHYKAADLDVSGDWSGAAFLLVAAALCSEWGITINNLNRNFTQADSAIVDVLRKCGAIVSEKKNSVTVKKGTVKAFDFDATDCPDLFPALVVLAAFSDGVCTLKGAKRLVYKESNRAKVLQEEFARTNIRIVVREDEMKVYPGHPCPAIISSHNDHRIAMAATVLGLAGSKITVNGAESTAKSFPAFFETMQKLGGKIRLK